MTVKELITMLSSANPDAEVVIMDEDDYINGEESTAYRAEDVINGLFDDQLMSFTGEDQIDNNERDSFGQEAVCIMISES